MQVTTIGLDIAKRVFQVHGVDAAGAVVVRKKLRRSELLPFFARLGSCLIGIEACATAHHWARELIALGHEVRLVPPSYVKAYLKRGKNDAADAEAICEAMARPGMRFVPVKTVEQQDIQAVHRVRASLVEQRSAKANQIRGLVAEYGLVAPRELLHLRRALPRWLDDEGNGLTVRFRWLLRGLRDELLRLDERIAELDREIEEIAQSEPDAKRLMQLRGVGPIIATAMLATVGDARQFRNGRQMSASLGLTPKQHSSGGKERMLGISKRGDAYLRSLLIHGARAVIRTARAKDDPLSRWVIRLADRSHPNVAAAALANKTTRIAWAMLSRGTNYQPAVN
jgi:transposase